MPKTKLVKNSIGLALLTFLIACETVDNNQQPAETVEQPKREVRLPSAEPLQSVSERDVLFAQTALKQLGFNPGFIDGMWGAQSANAMREFEKKQNIKSADGKLSELNLYTLSKNTKVLRSAIEGRKKTVVQEEPKTILSKLAASESQESAPQLIILDAPYPVLAKANPYSEVVTTLQAGTGVYILERQGEWYKIESEAQERGFIKENP